MGALLLARLQFALTIAFHFIFPSVTIGLAWLLVIIEWKGWKKNDEVLVNAGKFFGKIFALTFGIGVASGIVMEFQFGTNWAEYSKFVGDIFGAPLAAEGLFAFFLESVFLGLYLFGRKRVSKGVHWFSILMVAAGATISAFWIIVANSWQQTPDGFILRHGRAEMTDFFAVVFNPSTLPRFFHTVDATLTTGAFFMAGIAGYMLIKKIAVEIAEKVLKISLIFAFVVSVLNLFPFGHRHAQQVSATQPAKFAAMEGLYETQSEAPLTIFAIPQEYPKPFIAKIAIPGMLNLLTSTEPDAVIIGLNDIPPEEIPPVVLTFISFHSMFLLGLLFILISAIGVYLLIRNKLYQASWFHYVLKFSIPLPIIACQLGWMTAEVGRQPWIVYGLLRTEDAVSVTVSSGEIIISMLLIGIIESILLILWIRLTLGIINKHFQPAAGKEGAR